MFHDVPIAPLGKVFKFFHWFRDLGIVALGESSRKILNKKHPQGRPFFYKNQTFEEKKASP